MLARFSFSLLIAGLIVAPSRAQTPVPAGDITVHPQTMTLRQLRDPHAIQVLAASADGYSIDLRPQATFTSADPKIAVVDKSGWVRPVASGKTQITIAAAGKSKTVPVEVALPNEEPPMSFRHEVMPVLSRAGCNMGACHGYSLGKNGFKLSLRGSDPDLDYFAITKDAMGRRVLPLAPEASAIVAKARGDAPHEGGMRFARGTLSDKILNEWIRQGCPGDLADTAQVVKVRLVPDKIVLQPGQTHQLQLIAEYSNGTSRDVTQLGIFTANNPQYAEVSDVGLVTAGMAGETAIVARFERTFAAANVVSLAPSPKFTPTAPPKEHLIDTHVIEKLNRMKIDASPLAGDEEFLRRVFLDMIGVQPKPDEVKAFLGDADPKKRDKMIETLFDRPEFVDQWSMKFGDLTQNSRNTASTQSMFLFREFLRGAIASNMKMDEFARRLLTARGSSSDDPASVFLASSKDTNDTIERVTQVFCGVRMMCARCHAHPAENWTQADYYGLASFFSQMNTRGDTRTPNVPNAKILQYTPAAAIATNPRSGKPQPPRFLGGDEPKIEGDRREAYVKWLTAPENPFFARGFVNRVWSYFFHRGIIEPVDDIRSTNPPINPELLDALTKDFIASKYDLRHLIRRIVTSQTYQRSSQPTAANKHDEQNFSHAIPRRVPAEALLDSLVQATAVPEAFGGAPGGFRAAQLPDGNVESAFLKLFGKPARMDACECERDNSSNMLQALHFINGKSILGRLSNPAARPNQLAANKKTTDEELVTELYLWSISRRPREAEMKLGVEFLKSYEKREEAAQDLMWALLNSREFLMTH